MIERLRRCARLWRWRWRSRSGGARGADRRSAAPGGAGEVGGGAEYPPDAEVPRGRAGRLGRADGGDSAGVRRPPAAAKAGFFPSRWRSRRGRLPDLKRPRVIFVCAADHRRSRRNCAAVERADGGGRRRARRPAVSEPHYAGPRSPSRASGSSDDARHLARLTQRLESLQGKSFGSMQATELTLMESRLTPAGPIYSPVERVRLAG